MTFARTIVEQNIVPYNVLQLSHKHSRTFLEQFQSSSRTQFYKILELFKNSSRPFCRGYKYSRNFNLLTYVNLRYVHMTYEGHLESS